MGEDKGAAKTAGTVEDGAEFMSGAGEDHPNAGYDDPGATGPAPMPPVFPDAAEATAPVDGAANSGGGDPVGDQGGGDAPGTLNGKPYADNSPEDLAAETDRRELTVTGTGATGNVVKADSIKALEDDDKARASS